jgi:hypothetical protein
MPSRDVVLRFLVVLTVAGSIALIAGVYEVDRREKSSSETVAVNLRNLDERVELLADQVRRLSAQFVSQLNASERQGQALGSQVQALELRLNELEQKASASPRSR